MYPVAYSSLVQTVSSTLETQMPDRIGFGASVLSGKFLFSADFNTQDFSSFDYARTNNFKYSNSYSASFGVSRIGAKSLYADFFDRVTYNFGLGYNKLYYEVNGKKIDEYFGAFGFHMPVVGATAIDAAFTVGQRGTTESLLVKETFFVMSFNVSIGEIWFKPFKREY